MEIRGDKVEALLLTSDQILMGDYTLHIDWDYNRVNVIFVYYNRKKYTI